MIRLETTVSFVRDYRVASKMMESEKSENFSAENDFDVLGLAKEVFQDIYFCIHQVDGEEAASKLKQFIKGNHNGIAEENAGVKRHRKTDSLFAYNNGADDFDDISSEISFHLGDSSQSISRIDMTTQ